MRIFHGQRLSGGIQSRQAQKGTPASFTILSAGSRAIRTSNPGASHHDPGSHEAFRSGKLAFWNRGQHSGNTFSFAGSARNVIGQIPDGPRRLQGIAEYSGGTQLTTDLPVILDSTFNDTRPVPDARGVTVKKCGRFPIYGSQAKWCEIV
jgi:hypothetical protein